MLVWSNKVMLKRSGAQVLLQGHITPTGQNVSSLTRQRPVSVFRLVMTSQLNRQPVSDNNIQRAHRMTGSGCGGLGAYLRD